MVTDDAIGVARAAGAAGEVLVRGDSAYGHSTVVRACQRAGAQFSVVLVKNRAVTRAIAAIPDDAWVGVHYPGAVTDPETGDWISDAEVAAFTAFGSTRHPVTARLVVRRVRDRARLDELFGGVAAPPVPHRQSRTSPARRHHPPPPRDHRDRVRGTGRDATLRRTIVNVPARIARPQRRPMLHLQAHWPWADPWLTLWDRVLGDGLPPPIPA